MDPREVRLKNGGQWIGWNHFIKNVALEEKSSHMLISQLLSRSVTYGLMTSCMIADRPLTHQLDDHQLCSFLRFNMTNAESNRIEWADG